VIRGDVPVPDADLACLRRQSQSLFAFAKSLAAFSNIDGVGGMPRAEVRQLYFDLRRPAARLEMRRQYAVHFAFAGHDRRAVHRAESSSPRKLAVAGKTRIRLGIVHYDALFGRKGAAAGAIGRTRRHLFYRLQDPGIEPNRGRGH
jgi:hypothetical protein